MARRKQSKTVVQRIGCVSIRKYKTPNNTYRLYLDIRLPKRQYDFSSLKGLELIGVPEQDKQTEQLAQTIAMEVSRSIAAKRAGVPYYSRVRLHGDFVAYFEAQIVQRGDIPIWQSTLKHLRDFTGGCPAPFHSVNKEWVLSFQTHLSSSVSNASANVYFSTVKTALKKAVEDEILPRNPCDGVKALKQSEKVKSFLTESELRAMCRTPIKHKSAARAFIFACYTGLRMCDIRELRWRDVADGQSVILPQKKTGKVVSIPLHPVAIKMLNKSPSVDASALVFSLPCKAWMVSVVREWAKASGVTKYVNLHTSRHTFGTLLYTSTKDALTTKRLMGHTSMDTTQIYIALTDHKKRESVLMLPNIDDELPMEK